MKKLLAVVVALTMVMTLSVSAFAEDVVWSLAPVDLFGQYMESTSINNGGLLSSGGDGTMARIATNWQNGSVFSAILGAIKTEGAYVKFTTTGAFTTIGFQSDASDGNYEQFDVTESSVVDGNVVTYVSCADLIANCPVGVSGTYSAGWCNFYIDGWEDGTALLALEVVTGHVPAEPAVEEEPEAEAEPEAAPEAAVETAPETAPIAEAPDTGIALAVIPAIAALAAIAVSKKH